MKRSEVRDLMEGIRLSQIDEWVGATCSSTSL